MTTSDRERALALAAEVLEATEYDSSEDAYVIPARMGLRVMAGLPGAPAAVRDGVILVDPAASPEGRRFDAVREALRLILRGRGERASEALLMHATIATLTTSRHAEAA